MQARFGLVLGTRLLGLRGHASCVIWLPVCFAFRLLSSTAKISLSALTMFNGVLVADKTSLQGIRACLPPGPTSKSSALPSIAGTNISRHCNDLLWVTTPSDSAMLCFDNGSDWLGSFAEHAGMSPSSRLSRSQSSWRSLCKRDEKKKEEEKNIPRKKLSAHIVYSSSSMLILLGNKLSDWTVTNTMPSPFLDKHVNECYGR